MKSQIHTVVRLARLCVALALCREALGQSPPVCYQYDVSGNLVAASTNSVPLGATSAAVNQTLDVGQFLSLGVVVTNDTGAVTYQWRLNGTNIAGATNSTLDISSLGVTNAGTYSVGVSSSNGTLTNTAANISVVGTTNDLFGVAYGTNKFIAVGAGGVILSSVDQVAWTLVSSAANKDLNAITYANGKFVAVGAAGTVLTSSDGANWTTRTSGTAVAFHGLGYGNGQYLAVGDSGTIASSSDGISWTVNTYGNVTLEGIVYAASLWVVVGSGGTIWTSTNGIQWVVEDSQTLETLKSVTLASNNRFIAVGEDGTIVTSGVLDRYDWTLQHGSGNQTLEAVLPYAGSLWALGSPPQNLISADGLTWATSPSGTGGHLFAATPGPTNLVAVGRNGTIVNVPVLQVDHFVWDPISPQQRANRAFSVKVTAKDAENNTVTNFGGSVNFSALGAQSQSFNPLLGYVDSSTTLSGPGNITSGYSFTPNAPLQVTYLRSYFGTKVSIWDDSGNILASLSVAGYGQGAWSATTLGAPLLLSPGVTYRIGCFNPSTNSYYRVDLPPAFADGTINQSFYSSGDNCPFTAINSQWSFVDFYYDVARPNQAVSVSPISSGSFSNGAWSGSISVLGAGTNVTLQAADNQGHVGLSAPFWVVQTNDLSIYLTASPNPVAVSSNITYTMTVLNSGTGSATSVMVTNTLPSGVTYVGSNAPSQGAWTYSSGKGVWNVGTLGDFGSASMSFTASANSNSAGTVVVDSAYASRAEVESNLGDNSVAVSVYVPPTVQILNWSIIEGNFPAEVATLRYVVSPPSPLAISFNLQTIDYIGTNVGAIAGIDYGVVNETLIAAPFTTTNFFGIPIIGDLVPEPNKDFGLYYTSPTNATFPYNVSLVTIIDDDAITNQLNQFAWGAISWPQRAGASFSASVTAKDYLGGTVASFSGTGTVFGVNIAAATNNIMASKTPSFSNNLGNFTVGYSFTPSNDLCMTHVRHYAGAKVSVWTDFGDLLASQTVQSIPGTWLETQLPTPLLLHSNVTYRIGVATDSKTYYYRYDGALQFKDGNMGNSYYASGDAFPNQEDPARWYFVDARYAYPRSIQPSSVALSNGVWSGNVTIGSAGEDWRLYVQDTNGHFGWSSRLPVYNTNDFGTIVTWSPSTATVGTNLVYTVYVLNPGTNSSTSVTITDTIPANVTFVSAVPSQGSASQSGGVVSASLGTITALNSATVTITVTPTVAGAYLTNRAVIARNESDPNLTNNTAISVLIANLPLSLQIAGSVDNPGLLWRSGGSALWSSQTNTTHDATNAVQSGLITDNQITWLETDVRGPGTLSFWWKVSSEAGGDFLRFYTNSIQGGSISGLVDWQQQVWGIPPGFFTLRWSYEKNGSISSGSDAGWVDQVVYTIPSFYLTNCVLLTNGNFQFQLRGTNGQRLFVDSSPNLSTWQTFQTVTLASSNYVTLILSNAVAQTNGFLRAHHLNTP